MSLHSTGRWWAALTAVLVSIGALLILRGAGALYFGQAHTDLSAEFYPIRLFVTRWLHRGIFPYWNPHQFSGYPVAEILQAQVFEPIAITTALLFNARLSLLLQAALNILLCGGATWIAVRRCMGFSPPASCVAVLTYVYGGVFTLRICAGHYAVFGSMALMPLALLSFVRGVRETVGLLPQQSSTWTQSLLRQPLAILHLVLTRRISKWLVVCAIANGWIILMGSPQYQAYLFLMQVAAVCAMVPIRLWPGAVAALGACWVFAMALSAPQWLPAMSYLPFTARAHSSSMQDPGTPLVIPVMEFFLPYPLGSDILRFHLYTKNAWETASYPGAAAAVIAFGFIMAGAWRRNLRARMVAVLLLLSIILMSGFPIPGFSKFREPLKARVILAIAVSLACGLSIDYLAAMRRMWRRGYNVIFAAVGLAIGFTAAALAVWAAGNLAGVGRYFIDLGPPFSPPGMSEFQRAVENPEILGRMIRNSLWITTALSMTTSFLILASTRIPAARGILVLVIAGECLRVHIPAYVSRFPFDNVRLPAPLVNFLLPQIQADKKAGKPPWRVLLPMEYGGYSMLVEDLLESSGYDPLMPHGANNRTVLHGVLPGKERSIDAAMLAVARKYDFGSWRESTSGTVEETANLEVSPRAQLATLERKVGAWSPDLGTYGPTVDGEHFVVPSTLAQKGTSRNRLNPNFVQLIDEIAAGAESDFQTTDQLRMSDTGSPNRMKFEVETVKPALLLVRTTWLPGWRVKVDGEEVGRPLVANNWALGQVVQAGRHEIEFSYRPENLRLSLIISFAACITALLFLPGRRKREIENA